MSGNPGAQPEASSTELYFVVEGRVGRLIIWSCTNPIPLDWRVAFGPGTHTQCVEFLESQKHLTDH